MRLTHTYTSFMYSQMYWQGIKFGRLVNDHYAMSHHVILWVVFHSQHESPARPATCMYMYRPFAIRSAVSEQRREACKGHAKCTVVRPFLVATCSVGSLPSQ